MKRARLHSSKFTLLPKDSLKSLVKITMTPSLLLHAVRVLVYVSFPFVRSDYVISAGIGFRVVSGVVASP